MSVYTNVVPEDRCSSDDDDEEEGEDDDKETTEQHDGIYPYV